jgi:hypothetical protein
MGIAISVITIVCNVMVHIIIIVRSVIVYIYLMSSLRHANVFLDIMMTE